MKKISSIPSINITRANELVRAMFMEIASEQILPLPDVRNFKTSQMNKAPQSFDAKISVTLERRGRTFSFTGIIASQTENVSYMKIEYDFC